MENVGKTKEELLAKIKELESKVEQIDKEENKYQLAEKKFLEFINSGLIINVNIEDNITRYNNSKGELVIEIDYNSKKVWFSYYRFWSVFESIFGDNYQEIRNFLGGMVERHLKLQGFTPLYFFLFLKILVERHLKLQGFTPTRIEYSKEIPVGYLFFELI